MTHQTPFTQKPCKQRLTDMRPTAEGRFCTACQHSITDLRFKTNEEILALMKKRGRLCGVIAPDQMPISKEAAIPGKQPNRWRTQLLALYAALGASLLFPSVAKAQVPTEQTEATPQQTPYDSNYDTTIGEHIQGDSIEIIAHFYDAETGEALPFVIMLIKNTKLGGTTDFDGRLMLTLDRKALPDQVAIEVRYIGYKSIEYSFAVAATNLLPDFYLQKDDHCYLSVGVIIRQPWYKGLHRKVWWRVKHPLGIRKKKQND